MIALGRSSVRPSCGVRLTRTSGGAQFHDTCSEARVIAEDTASVRSGYSEKDASSDSPVIVIETEYGVIRIKPYTAAAPRCADLVLRLAKTSTCAGCNFYRHEHVPKVSTQMVRDQHSC